MDTGSLLGGRYRLDRSIGAGGMGQVWAAHDTVLGRDVAVKVQKFDPDGDRAAFDRFVREARTAAALQHPNVVTIFDSGTDRDRAFLVMELLPGLTLAGYVAQRGPLPEREVVALTPQIASGLAAAHQAGVVHRDIKPSNLMFDARGTLKIVDFGIAYLAQTAAARLTATNVVIGSPPYLSPEQLQGRPADERSDLYALGCVMTTMLTGRPPFDGEHPLAYAHQHVSTRPPPIRERRPGIDPALDALVAQLLDKSPEDRPQSAREVVDRLSADQPGSPAPGEAAATTVVLRQDTLPLLPETAAPPAAAGQSQRRSTPGRWVVAGAAVLAGVAAVLLAVATATDVPRAAQPESSRSAPASAAPSSATRESASPSGPPQTTPAATPPSSEASRAERGLQGALSDLRAAVRAVSQDGQVEAKKGEELSKRVDELAKHLAEERGEKRGKERGKEAGMDKAKDQAKKVDDLDKYVAELSRKGELTPEGERRITEALGIVREQAAES